MLVAKRFQAKTVIRQSEQVEVLIEAICRLMWGYVNRKGALIQIHLIPELQVFDELQKPGRINDISDEAKNKCRMATPCIDSIKVQDIAIYFRFDRVMVGDKLCVEGNVLNAISAIR